MSTPRIPVHAPRDRRPPPEASPAAVSRAEAVAHFAAQLAEEIYTDTAGARRHLAALRERLDDDDGGGVAAAYHGMLGVVANLEHDYARAEDLLRRAREEARLGGQLDYALELGADLAGVLLNLNRVAESAALIDATREEAAPRAWDGAWQLDVREGFVHLGIGDVAAALAKFASARKGVPDLAAATGATVRHAHYAALLYAGLGRVYLRGGEAHRAIEAYDRVVGICAAANIRGRLAYHYLDLGRAHMAAHNAAEAVHSFCEAMEVAGAQDRLALAAASANLGYYALEERRWRRAERHFDAAEHHYRAATVPVRADLSRIAVWRARMAAARRGRARHVEPLLLTALEHANASDDRAQVASVCALLAEHYAAAGEFESAYNYRVLHDEIRREVDAAASERRLGELELRHELEERRTESQLLKLGAAQLQLKALRAQMNPHFIFNALNSIQEVITSKRPDEAAAHLAHFARLMRQSLDYSEREVISLEEEVGFLRNYLELSQRLRFRDAFTFEIAVGDELEDDLVGLPAMLVQPYVENALEHGIRLVDAGHVRIEFGFAPRDGGGGEPDEDTLRIAVSDNGVGREASARQRRARRGQTEHKSMGTSITQNRLELLNRGLGRAASVRYEDLRDGGSGEPRGTLVVITIPIRWLA